MRIQKNSYETCCCTVCFTLRRNCHTAKLLPIKTARHYYTAVCRASYNNNRLSASILTYDPNKIIDITSRKIERKHLACSQ